MVFRNRLLEEFEGVNPDLHRLATMGEDLRPTLEAALAGDNLSLAGRAVLLAAMIGSMDLVSSAAEDPRAPVRAAAVAAVGKEAEDEPPAIAVELMNDPHPAVRRIVAQVISTCGPEQAIPLLEAMRTEETDDTVINELDDAIEKLRKNI